MRQLATECEIKNLRRRKSCSLKFLWHCFSTETVNEIGVTFATRDRIQWGLVSIDRYRGIRTVVSVSVQRSKGCQKQEIIKWF